MLVNGVCLDHDGAQIREDGFSIKRHEDLYILTVAVVNVASKLTHFDNYLTGDSRNSLFPRNNIRKSKLSFSSTPQDALLFLMKIDMSGKVVRFRAMKGRFAAKSTYHFSDTVTDSKVYHAKECLNMLAESGLYPFITHSKNNSQLVNNLNVFTSLCLYEFMVNQMGVSVVYNGVSAGDDALGGRSSSSYRMDVGRLCLLNSNLGVRVVNGEGFLVNTVTKRDVVYHLSDVKSGNFTMPISSPFRQLDALVNQIILNDYLDGNAPIECDYAELKIYGLSYDARQRYIIETTRMRGEEEQVRDLAQDRVVSGKILRKFVSLLVANKLESQQVRFLSQTLPIDISDRVYLCSYYFALGFPLPKKLFDWVKKISAQGGGVVNEFMHLLSGMPFIESYNSGGVFSLTVNHRLYEVDYCSGHQARLLKKMISGLSREKIAVPQSYHSKIELLCRLIEDPAVLKFLNKRGIEV